MNNYPILSLKYGFGDRFRGEVIGHYDLGFEISKISQSAYAAAEFSIDNTTALESSASLSELFSKRLFDLQSEGKFTPFSKDSNLSLFAWLVIRGDKFDGIEIITRCFSSLIKLFTNPTESSVQIFDEYAVFKAKNNKRVLSESAIKTLTITALWADVDFEVRNNDVSQVMVVVQYRDKKEHSE